MPFNTGFGAIPQMPTEMPVLDQGQKLQQLQLATQLLKNAGIASAEINALKREMEKLKKEAAGWAEKVGEIENLKERVQKLTQSEEELRDQLEQKSEYNKRLIADTIELRRDRIRLQPYLFELRELKKSDEAHKLEISSLKRIARINTEGKVVLIRQCRTLYDNLEVKSNEYDRLGAQNLILEQHNRGLLQQLNTFKSNSEKALEEARDAIQKGTTDCKELNRRLMDTQFALYLPKHIEEWIGELMKKKSLINRLRGEDKALDDWLLNNAVEISASALPFLGSIVVKKVHAYLVENYQKVDWGLLTGLVEYEYELYMKTVPQDELTMETVWNHLNEEFPKMYYLWLEQITSKKYT